MLKITEFKGTKYYSHRDWYGAYYRDDWMRFEWDTGFLEIQKKKWDKLNKKMRDRILSAGGN